MPWQNKLYELTASYQSYMLRTDGMNGNSGKLFKIFIQKIHKMG